MTNKQIVEKIKKAKNIAIFGHRDPDYDACGAMFGLRDFCHKIGKSADVFAEKMWDDILSHIFPMSETKSEFHCENYDLILIVDLHLVGRLEKPFQEEVLKCKNIVIIDHHMITKNDILPTKNFWIEDKAAASMLVLDLFREQGIVPSTKGATYLYAGIMGDTDRFLHSNLSKEVFEDAMFLMENNADIQFVYNYMYRYVTREQIKVNQVLYNKLVYLEGGKVAYVIFTLKDMKKLNVKVDTIKEFSNTIVCIKDVEVSFLIYEVEKNKFKFSVRSSEVNLIPFCSKKGGGGHKNASGFALEMSKGQIKKNMPQWSKEIFNG